MTENFIYNGKKLSNGPKWFVTEFNDGSMRFRWNEANQNRLDYIEKIEKKFDCAIAQIELTHSKDVFFIETKSDLDKKTGDGILTFNKKLIPLVTVADCVPIFLFDVKTKAFGVAHSGWKGTGIVQNAIDILLSKGSDKKDICIAIGPHIHQCCYEVQKDLKEYFEKNFSTNCIEVRDNRFYLSLAQANLYVLRKYGIPEENIFISEECTCCKKENANYKYGSCRRQGKENFVVQNAFIVYK